MCVTGEGSGEPVRRADRQSERTGPGDGDAQTAAGAGGQ